MRSHCDTVYREHLQHFQFPFYFLNGYSQFFNHTTAEGGCACWAFVHVLSPGLCDWDVQVRRDVAQGDTSQGRFSRIPSLCFKSAGSGLGIHTVSSTLTFRENRGLFSRSECVIKGAGVIFL